MINPIFSQDFMRITKKNKKKQKFIQDKLKIKKDDKLWYKVLIPADLLESTTFWNNLVYFRQNVEY